MKAQVPAWWGLLLITFCGSVVLAETQVDCYQCVWQSSWSVPGPDEDFCRPATFNGQRVTVAPCPQGCVTTVMYETDPHTSPPTNSNKDDKPPMTYFMRGCPSGDTMRKNAGCEEKSYRNVFREECFCTSPLCNGNAGSEGLVPHKNALFTIFLFTLVALAAVAMNRSKYYM